MAKFATILTLFFVPTALVPEVADAYEGRHKGCNTRSCDKRMDKKVRAKVKARKWKVVRPYNAWLENTARCESGGRWFIATGNGFYGGLQFTLQSWRAVGGRGMPHQNSVLEQKFRGVKLLFLQGRGAWPVCG
jgi:hypothetical protein